MSATELLERSFDLGVVVATATALRNRETRTTAGLITTMRFDSLGLVIIGTELHGNNDYLGPAISFSLVSVITVMVAALVIGRRAAAADVALRARPREPRVKQA